MRIHKVLPFLLALAALPAEATTTYYCSDASCGGNTEAAFTAAFGVLLTAGLTSTGTVNFTGATSGVTVSNVGGTGASFTGFNGASSSLLNVVASQLQNTNGGLNSGLSVSLPTGSVYVFGAHVKASGNALECFEVTLGNCDLNFLLTSSATSFVGIIGDIPLVGLQMRGSTFSGKLYVNDFSMAETPEASTFVLVGVGLILFPLLKRRARGVEPSLQC